MSDTDPVHGLSVRRVEALTDGIYAVAMTLLVIELKLPDHSQIQGAQDLAQALANLLPKGLAWVISFSVLAIFWFGQLAFVSLMPFSCALAGEHGREMLSQLVYSANMAGLAVMALLTSRYIRRYPEASMMALPALAPGRADARQRPGRRDPVRAAGGRQHGLHADGADHAAQSPCRARQRSSRADPRPALR